jgi:hypothetical protein
VRPTTDGFGGKTQEFRFHHQSWCFRKSRN